MIIIQFIIKKGQLYLEKRKWRNRRYYYYFTKDLYKAVVLSEKVSAIWRKNIQNTEEGNITISKLNIVLEDNLENSRQYVLTSSKDSLPYVSNPYYSHVDGKFVRFKKTEYLFNTLFVNDSKHLQRLLKESKMTELIDIKKVIRQEI